MPTYLSNRMAYRDCLCYTVCMENFVITPIAHIHTPFKEKFGIPRQSGRVGAPGKIVFDPQYRVQEAVRGLADFSHIWLIFDFSKAHVDEWSATVRPPRLGGNTKMGVFATRSPYRPNSLGLSLVKLVGIEHTKSQGDVLVVEGVDLLDGTPIYDIKPYLATDVKTDAKFGFSTDCDSHRLDVDDARLSVVKDENAREKIKECIAQDPRPAYQNDDRTYGMRYDDYNVKFVVDGNKATVIDVEIVK